ncbi:MAG: hypothetical protein HY774_10315 [Acidobacteria bacterium]|nr:hypothetical protein [Acidobacteriota bacterium]
MRPLPPFRVLRVFTVLVLVTLAAHLWNNFLPWVSAQGDMVVTTTTDNGDNANPTPGSLRFALAKITSGNRIVFNVPRTDPGFSNGTVIFRPPVQYPALNASDVTIDGTIQTTMVGDTNPQGPEIFISGERGLNAGLLVSTSRNTIRGLGVINFRGGDGAVGIAFEGEGASSNKVFGCFIGIGPDGVQSAPNTRGVIINESNGNQIGGPAATERNVISGNTEIGIQVSGFQTQGNLIQNNLIGPAANGEAAVTGTGNQRIAGISVEGLETQIIGNVISGNGGIQGGDGLVMTGDKNTVTGNRIGTNLTGTTAIPNGLDGITVGGSANRIGGLVAGEGNQVSGNGRNGIFVGFTEKATANLIQGNLIGVDATGQTALANDGFGVIFLDGANSNLVGGNESGAGNVIAFNRRAGVGVINNVQDSPTTRNRIARNSIFKNAELGIDLGINGVTANDLGDEDEGANELMNFAALQTFETISSTQLRVTGQSNLGSQVEIFVADPDPSGFGQGKQFVTSFNMDKETLFNVTITIPAGAQALTATATDDKGNTSEFCRNLVLNSEPPPPDDTTPPQVTVLSPNGKEKVKSAQPFAINWSSDDNVAVTTHSILLSTDGGATFPITVVTGLEGSARSFIWSESKPKAKQARIKIVARDAAGNTGEDASNANFKIK